MLDMNGSSWRGKDDEDLSYEDLGQMLDEGQPVALTAPPRAVALPRTSTSDPRRIKGNHFNAKRGVLVRG